MTQLKPDRSLVPPKIRRGLQPELRLRVDAQLRKIELESIWASHRFSRTGLSTESVRRQSTLSMTKSQIVYLQATSL